MKRKEINEYAQSIVVRLYDIGYFGSVQELFQQILFTFI